MTIYNVFADNTFLKHHLLIFRPIMDGSFTCPHSQKVNILIIFFFTFQYFSIFFMGFKFLKPI